MSLGKTLWPRRPEGVHMTGATVPAVWRDDRRDFKKSPPDEPGSIVVCATDQIITSTMGFSLEIQHYQRGEERGYRCLVTVDGEKYSGGVHRSNEDNDYAYSEALKDGCRVFGSK